MQNTTVSQALKTVTVPLGADSYRIYIGSKVLANDDLIQSYIHSKQVCIVSQRVVADLYLPTLLNSLQGGDTQLHIETVLLPEGETHKNQASLDLIYERLIAKKFSRDCLLIALGGGIVGDITGFAAATYQRGVDFVQIPTTLLSQVDSSVGGKTGINHRLGKNLIGAFHQPKAVFIETDALNTLPVREIAAGLAEVIKYGLIRDRDFLTRLDAIIDDVVQLDAPRLAEIIALSCQHKADVVEADEKEHGERATLNLGHTFGHAIEALTDYKTYLHGEAVAIGTMMALELSHDLGWLSLAEVQFAEQLFQRANCPVDLSDCAVALTPAAIRAAMQRDKKVRAGKVKLILLEKLGKALIRDDIDEALILAAIQRRLAKQAS